MDGRDIFYQFVPLNLYVLLYILVIFVYTFFMLLIKRELKEFYFDKFHLL